MKMPTELAGGVIRNEAGEILFLHRALPGARWWEIPGGKREAGETAEQALARELSEELGVEVLGLRYLGRLSFFVGEEAYVDELFDTKIAGVPRALEGMHDAVAYFPLSRLGTMQEFLSTAARKLYEDITNGTIRLDS